MKILMNVKGNGMHLNGEGIGLKQKSKHPFHVTRMERVKIIQKQTQLYTWCLEIEAISIQHFWLCEQRYRVIC